jgi:hypothetical protein
MSTHPVRVERRVGQRFPYLLAVSLRDPVTSVEGVGCTQDVSSRGVFFFTDVPLNEGSEIELTLRMPSEITLGESMPVRCRARILRIEGRHSASNATTGCRSPAGKLRISRYIQRILARIQPHFRSSRRTARRPSLGSLVSTTSDRRFGTIDLAHLPRISPQNVAAHRGVFSTIRYWLTMVHIDAGRPLEGDSRAISSTSRRFGPLYRLPGRSPVLERVFIRYLGHLAESTFSF